MLEAMNLLGGQLSGGQVEFFTAGTTEWVVPEDVTNICAVCVGTGSQVKYVYTTSARIYTPGQGGSLRWMNDIPVTPGETLKIYITAPAAAAHGSQNDYVNFTPAVPTRTQIIRGSDVILAAAGGGGQTLSPSVNGQGGNGGANTIASPYYPGSTGPGGYSGNGATTGNPGDPTAGTAGVSSYASQVISGYVTDVYTTTNSGGVSLRGSAGGGTLVGQGGGGIDQHRTGNTYYQPGIGGVRIIWGNGRSYPDAAADV